VKVTVGSISDGNAVEEVVKGADAVIETLSAGSPGNLPGTVKRDGVAAIILAMKKLGVKRLVVLSTGLE
jgi:putative NADH-flavin reductase